MCGIIVKSIIIYTPTKGRGYNPRQRRRGDLCSLTNCKHIFGFYYNCLNCDLWDSRIYRIRDALGVKIVFHRITELSGVDFLRTTPATATKYVVILPRRVEYHFPFSQPLTVQGVGNTSGASSTQMFGQGAQFRFGCFW